MGFQKSKQWPEESTIWEMVHQKDLALVSQYHGDMELHPCYYHWNLNYENMEADGRVSGDEKVHDDLQLEKDSIQGNVRYVQA